MANVIIDIAAEFTGNRAFKQAGSSTDKLTKNVKKLAKGLGLAFGTTQVLAFGKASLKAFGEDEKAATRLTKAVENLGLGFEDARIKTFIADLEKTAGVSDDVLRPAFQSLLQTTGSVAKSQELLKLALDVSAGSGVDAIEVAKDLSLAYLGQTKGLAKYNTGLTKTELNTASFAKIQATLSDQFAGQNEARLSTYAGKMEALGVAAGNAQEIIGKGLVDALSMLGEDDSVSTLASDMENVALYIGDAIRGVGVLVETLKSIPGAGVLFDAFKLGFKSTPLGLLNELGKANRLAVKPFSTPMSISGSTDADAKAAAARKKAEEEARKRALELLKIKNKQLDTEKKALAAKKLAAAIDKATLALNKGQEIFDMDKIQIAAALTNQAEQLGKATNTAQLMQIANDTARLNVKRSILDLEDAIAAKDEKAIIAATNKLNADLKILNAINGQNVSLLSLKSILESLKPAELIDQDNLDLALKKILEMLELLKKVGGGTISPLITTKPTKEPKFIDYIKPLDPKVLMQGSIDAILEYSDAATTRANAIAELVEYQNKQDQLALDEYIKKLGLSSTAVTVATTGSVPTPSAGEIQSGNRYAAQAAATYNITIQTGVGDPNAIAEAVSQVLKDAQQRGTLTSIGAFDR